MTEENNNQIVQHLEKDVLLLYYNFSDQHGVVDVKQAAVWAKEKLGMTIPQTPFILTQKHIDFLIESGALPDLRETLRIVRDGKRTRPEPPEQDVSV